MPIPAPVQRLSFPLTPEVENQLMERVLDEEIKRIDEELDRAFPDDMLPTMEALPGPKRLERYNALTPESDAMMLEHDTYLEDLAAGMAPPPFSKFWQQMLTIPDLFGEVQKDYNQLRKKYT
jgi:Mg/Co/Ni transporter MgtE